MSDREDRAVRRIYLPLLVVLALLATPRPQSASATEKLTADIMKIALHTSTAQEDGFIEYVLERVDRGTLPLSLVQSTFLWAKKKPYKKFFYFKQGLILRAQKQGIVL
jgi:hypothetical protein